MMRITTRHMERSLGAIFGADPTPWHIVEKGGRVTLCGQRLSGHTERTRQGHRAAPLCLSCQEAARPSIHRPEPTCWCQPTVEYEDPISGARVYVHHGLDGKPLGNAYMGDGNWTGPKPYRPRESPNE